MWPRSARARLSFLLHGFPQFWWAWRDQLIALSEAGYHVAAIDLRGYGASDKPPRGYDTFTLAADVASIVRSLGEGKRGDHRARLGRLDRLVDADHAARRHQAVAALGMPHPLVLRHASVRNPAQVRANAYLAGLQRPFVPEHQMSKSPAYVERLLGAWSAPGMGCGLRTTWRCAMPRRWLCRSLPTPPRSTTAGWSAVSGDSTVGGLPIV